MNRFNTLLQREWMQHRFGWLVVLFAPLVLVILAGLFTELGVQVELDGETVIRRTPEAVLQTLGAIGGMAAVTLGIAWLTVLFQAPGLARRDTQDRSIEFWLSLPIGHVPSLGATLLAHLLLLPIAALAVGALGGLAVSMLVVVKTWGFGAWLGLPWGTLLLGFVAMLLRLACGVVLATLWLSPLILLTMAASAWLKRWGVPAVAAVIGLGGLALDKLYGTKIVWRVLQSLGEHASKALFMVDRDGGSMKIENVEQLRPVLQGLPGWALGDLGAALAGLASPAFVGALAVGIAGFALLVLRRQRGA